MVDWCACDVIVCDSECSLHGHGWGLCKLIHARFLWGCQDLKYKILIKNKKLKPQIRTEAEESVGEGEDDEEEDDEEDEDHQDKAKFWSPRKAGSKTKVSQIKNRK